MGEGKGEFNGDRAEGTGDARVCTAKSGCATFGRYGGSSEILGKSKYKSNFKNGFKGKFKSELREANSKTTSKANSKAPA